MLQCFNSKLQNVNFSKLQRLNTLTLTCLSTSTLQHFIAFQPLKASKINVEGFKDKCFNVSVMPQCLILQPSMLDYSKLQSLTLHRFNASILQHPCIKGNNINKYFHKVQRKLFMYYLIHT
jgi:hypothetical protein